MTGAEERLAVGVDVGATKITAALVDRKGAVIRETRAATRADAGPSGVISQIAGLACELMGAAPVPVAGIGVGTPGYVDPVAGVVTNAVNLSWDVVDFVGELRPQLGIDIPVWVENDANVMALGECYYGAARGCGDLVYVSIGSGLGSGILVNHELVAGANFRAADLGHLSLDAQGRECACGLRGCVETVVSGPGTLATAREFLARGESSSLPDAATLTPEHVLLAACDGDPLALAVFDYTAVWLGQALAACVALLNPARIVIGGGMGLAAFELLKPGVCKEFTRRIIPYSYADLQILPSQVHSTAVGASSLVWHATLSRHAA